MKIVVLDLDETLGYFTQLGIFWDCLSKCFNNLTKEHFFKIFDLFPQFMRPNIINILKYLKYQKIKKTCTKVVIYTNNTGPKEWADNILKYFERKIKYKLFDQIVAAYKINGKQIELCRTTHNKTHSDFIKCTKIPENADICFIDDVFHDGMSNEKITYINIKPYFHDISFTKMINKFINSAIGKKLLTQNNLNYKIFSDEMKELIDLYKYDIILKNKNEHNVDEILGKRIILHLHNFFET